MIGLTGIYFNLQLEGRSAWAVAVAVAVRQIAEEHAT